MCKIYRRKNVQDIQVICINIENIQENACTYKNLGSVS